MRRLVGLGVFLAVAGVAWGQLVPAGMRALADEEGAVPGVAYEFPVLEGGEVISPKLAWIPAGSFSMGNSYSNLYPDEGWAHELPVHTVPVSGFFMGRYEFTHEELARTLQWAWSNGLVEVGPTVVTNVQAGVTNVVTNLYGTVRNTEGTKRELVDLDAMYCQIAFTNGAFAVAEGKTNFPAVCVTWHGALAVCNYLSDWAGLERAVDFGPAEWSVDVAAEGYRLPTEAEWEKACRGGNPGTHFPWPDDSAQGTNNYLWNIDPVKANYWDARYGTRLTNHPMHPWFGEPVRTTPVGYYNGAQVVTNLHTNFAIQAGTTGADFGRTNDMVNGYGLYDMAGNVYEWCWDYHGTDWYADPAASLPDPTGPAAEASFHTQRVARGGGFTYYIGASMPDPSFQRCAFHTSFPAVFAATYLGFRVARRPTGYEGWAIGEGLDPLAANGAAGADYDGDGFSNEQERLVGTQPTNASSFFRVEGVGVVSNGAPVVFRAVSGRVYRVEGMTNLAGGGVWQPLGTVTSVVTGEVGVSVDAVEPRRYFRIRAWMAP